MAAGSDVGEHIALQFQLARLFVSGVEVDWMCACSRWGHRHTAVSSTSTVDLVT